MKTNWDGAGVGRLIGHLQRADRGLVLFAFWAFLFTAFGLWAGSTDDAYADYYHNRVIRWVQLGASGIDLSILLVAACWRWSRLPQWSAALPLSLLAVAGTWLVWFELWYGSTFYYGEVRDKQGLPYNVNNFGAMGSFVFLAYLIWRFPLGRMRSGWSVAVRCGLTALLFLGQKAVLGMVCGPWNIVDS
jgi:hypothetical protein